MVLNINGTLDVERSDINNAINKEKQNQRDITGITTDNLQVQGEAIFEVCLVNIQDIQNILYFRCVSHLLSQR